MSEQQIAGSQGRSGAPPGVDLPDHLCAEIRSFAERLPDMTYFEILGVERDADEDAIRRGFFNRSKVYHPDRYFHRELGPYAELLHEIYKRVVAAHDVLRDPRMRQDYERTLREKPSFRIIPTTHVLGLPGQQKPEPEPEAESGKRRSLRDRAGLRSKNTVLLDLQLRLEASRQKARKHYDEAMREAEQGDLLRAASLVRLALAFDPREPEYHNALADVLPRANAEQAAESRAKGEMLLGRGDAKGALEYLEEAFRVSPTDAELGHQVAQLLIGEGEIDRGIETARQATELDDRIPEYFKTLGLALMEHGKLEDARKQLQRAWELDPLDRDVKKALAVL